MVKPMFILLISAFLVLSACSFTTETKAAVQWSPLQELINRAPENSIISVPPGIYYGTIRINKSLTIIGTHVTLDANYSEVGVLISASNVKLEGFTILNAAHFDGYELDELQHYPQFWGSGIYVYFSNNVIVSSVTISQCYAGVGFAHSSQSYVINSTISQSLFGIMLYCSNAEIFNSVIDTIHEYIAPNGWTQTVGCGIWVGHYSQINMTYDTLENSDWAITITDLTYYSYVNHNNFIKNRHNVFIHPDAQREVANWTSNFWSDYKGVDLNVDDVGDTPYIIDINNQDPLPLMKEVYLPTKQGGGGGLHYLR